MSVPGTAHAVVSLPEPDLTPLEMLRRAEALRPVLRERQPLCEQLGRLPEETNDEFLRAGFYRIVQPRMFGGYEFSLPDFIRVMMEVSRGCPESGWVLTLTSGHPEAFIAGFSEQAQREVYGETGDCRAPGVFVPGGSAIPVPGGYRIKLSPALTGGAGARGIIARAAISPPIFWEA
jgi:3-hydroxy-9,10-secoandrosta-1,3,5(10)-triene-9,17-dione monooxygenase